MPACTTAPAGSPRRSFYGCLCVPSYGIAPQLCVGQCLLVRVCGRTSQCACRPTLHTSQLTRLATHADAASRSRRRRQVTHRPQWPTRARAPPHECRSPPGGADPVASLRRPRMVRSKGRRLAGLDYWRMPHSPAAAAGSGGSSELTGASASRHPQRPEPMQRSLRRRPRLPRFPRLPP